MQITDKVQETKEVEKLTDVRCNKCGESLRRQCAYEGLAEAEITGGYGSNLGDGVAYRFSLCEGCLSRMFAEWKHPPAVKHHMFGPFEYVQPTTMEHLEKILNSTHEIPGTSTCP